jgi:phosphatidylglycerophosphate synthase
MENFKPEAIKNFLTAIICFRVVVSLILIIDALDGSISWWFVWVFGLAFLSDLIDGPIARHFKVVSDEGSKMDGIADIVLFAAIIFCIWLSRRHVIEAFLIPILTVGFTQTTSWIISLVKFGRLTSYHSYVAKLWAFSIAVAIISLFGFNRAGLFFWSAIVLGLVSNFEDIFITLVMPYWSCDILTPREALRLRREYLRKKRIS